MDRKIFFAELRKRGSGVFGTSLSQGQVDALNLMLDEGQERGLALRHLAYVLAVPYHEVGSGLQPRAENLTYTTAAQIRKTWPSRFKTVAAAQPYVRNPQKLANRVYGSRMGNTGPNDGWVYRGRGLPQITGKEMYEKLGKLLDIDLVANPDRAMELRIAATIMFEGMIRGLFTGKKLADFILGTKADYRGARAIINGDVKANGPKVAGYAVAFEKALRAAGYVSQSPQPRPTIPPEKPEPAPSPKPSPEPQPAPAAPDAAKTGVFVALIAALVAAGAWVASLPCNLLGVFCS